MGECWNCGATADDDWSCQACRTERGLAQDLADAGREIERLRAEVADLQALIDAYAEASTEGDQYDHLRYMRAIGDLLAAATKEDDR